MSKRGSSDEGNSKGIRKTVHGEVGRAGDPRPNADLDKPISDLLAEAISDLVRKHGRTEVVYSTIVPEGKKGKK